jgi:Family of unknown function (DUF6526)
MAAAIQREHFMADKSPQNFANHARFDPPFHFFVVPVFAISWVISIVFLVRHPGFYAAWGVVLATAAVVAVFKIRLNALRVQDRLIRLEERLRLAGLLPESQRPQIATLNEGQLIGLRFACDEEVPALVQRAVAENLSRNDIKKAIGTWRPDYSRV